MCASLQSCLALCDPMDYSLPGFSRQEYWSGWPFPPPEGLHDPGIEPLSLTSPVLASGLFTTSATQGAPLPHQVSKGAPASLKLHLKIPLGYIYSLICNCFLCLPLSSKLRAEICCLRAEYLICESKVPAPNCWVCYLGLIISLGSNFLAYKMKTW